jgi:hypothetical protein
MKQILIFMMALATSLSAFAQDEQKIHVDEAQVVKETHTIKDFTKLKVNKGINVTLIKGDEPSAEINIVNTSLSDVIIENDQNELTIKMKTRIYQDVSVQVYLTYRDIREISLGSGSSIDNQEALEGKVLILNAGLDSVIDLKLDVTSVEADVSAARITLEGYARTLEGKATAGGKLQGQNLEVEKAYVTANTGGIATVNASELLDAKAGTGGTIEYLGEPKKLSTKETFGGKVVKI